MPTPTPDSNASHFLAPSKTKADQKTGTKSGYLGARFDGSLGAAGTVENVLPLVELDGVRPIAVRLFQDLIVARTSPQIVVALPDLETSRPFLMLESTVDGADPGAAHVALYTPLGPPGPDADLVSPFLFADDPSGGEPGAGFLAIHLTGEPLPDRETSLEIVVSNEADGGSPFAPDVPVGTVLRIEWPGGVARWTVVSLTPFGDSVSYEVAPLDNVGTLSDLNASDPVSLVLVLPQPAVPVSRLESTQLIVSVDPNDGGADIDTDTFQVGRVVRLLWTGGMLGWEIQAVATLGGTPDYMLLTVALVANDGDADAVAGEDPVSLVLLTPRAPVLKNPNACPRARVTYEGAKTGPVSFDCDWTGGFVVHASRIEIARVTVTPNPSADAIPSNAHIAAMLAIEGEEPAYPPQLTVPAELVAESGFRKIEIPNFARRVTLLTRYGEGDAPSGDAPLGQMFVAFALPYEGSLGYIDAMSARESLFGDGLAIPHGATDLVITNLTSSGILLGAIFHLGV